MNQARIDFEPELVEECVRLAFEGGRKFDVDAPLALRRVRHRLKLDTIYRQPPGEEREQAFLAHFREVFRKLGFEQRLVDCLAQFPCLRRELSSLQVRSDLGSGEGAELWESRDGRGSGIPVHLIIRLAPQRFHREGELRQTLLPSLSAAAEQVESAAHLAGATEDASAVPAPAGGQACPLCRFPTFVWAGDEDVAELHAAIVADFPGWSASDGCCGHCADRYALG